MTNFDIENLVKFANGELPVEESMLIRQEMENDAFLQQIVEGIRIDELNNAEESLVDFIDRTGSEFKADILNENVTTPQSPATTPASGIKGLGYALAAFAILGLSTFVITTMTENNDTETPIIEVSSTMLKNIDDAGFSFEVIKTSTDEKQLVQQEKEDFKVVEETVSEDFETINETKLNYRVSLSTTKSKEDGQEKLTAKVEVVDANEATSKATELPNTPVELNSESYSVKVNDAGTEKEMDIIINSKAEHKESAYPAAIYLINSLPKGTYQASATITSNSKVKQGKEVTFVSGDNVILKPGFEVKQGASFEIKIEKEEK